MSQESPQFQDSSNSRLQVQGLLSGTSHIPGALHAELFHYFISGTDKKGLKKFHNDLARHLGNLGLTGKETAVVYESKFGTQAAKVAWMLEYAGLMCALRASTWVQRRWIVASVTATYRGLLG